MPDSRPEDHAHASLSALRERIDELEEQNLELEREVARRGVKLSCANVALARAKIAFDEISQNREATIQDVAHDLKTPLTSIRGAAQNVIDGIAGPVVPDVREYLEIIRDQSDRLVGVVNWLVQAIRITSQELTLEAHEADVTAMTQRIVRGLKPIADEKRIALSSDGEPLMVCVDEAKLAQAVENIVGNALKFTKPGGEVRVAVRQQDAQCHICVSDTGIGLGKQAQQRIFHRYYRATTEADGSGLGLLIAREMVRLHNGDIQVESQLGKGSTLTIRLPILPRGEVG